MELLYMIFDWRLCPVLSALVRLFRRRGERRIAREWISKERKAAAANPLRRGLPNLPLFAAKVPHLGVSIPVPADKAEDIPIQL